MSRAPPDALLSAEVEQPAATSVSAAAGGAEGKGKQKNIVFQNGMQIFTFAKGGLMYEASIGGQKFSYKPKKQAD